MTEIEILNWLKDLGPGIGIILIIAFLAIRGTLRVVKNVVNWIDLRVNRMVQWGTPLIEDTLNHTKKELTEGKDAVKEMSKVVSALNQKIATVAQGQQQILDLTTAADHTGKLDSVSAKLDAVLKITRSYARIADELLQPEDQRNQAAIRLEVVAISQIIDSVLGGKDGRL